MSFEGENERDGEVEDGMAEEEWECVRKQMPWAGLGRAALGVCGWGKVPTLSCLTFHAMPCHAMPRLPRPGKSRQSKVGLD